MEHRYHVKSLRDALADRGEFLRVILIGSLLALGINLITSVLDKVLGAQWLIITVGIVSTLLAILLLSLRIFGSRRIKKTVKAIIIYNRETNEIEPIHKYEFSEEISRIFKALFQENPAFRTIWDKEPLWHPKSSESDGESVQEPARGQDKPKYLLARISPGLSWDGQRQDLAFLPIQIPAIV